MIEVIVGVLACLGFMIAIGCVIEVLDKYFSPKEYVWVESKENIKSVELYSYTVTFTTVDGGKTSLSISDRIVDGRSFQSEKCISQSTKVYDINDFKEHLRWMRIFVIPESGTEIVLDKVVKIEYEKQSAIPEIAETSTIVKRRFPKDL